MDDGLFSLEGRIALVTGGNGDIGQAIAELFLKRGARVYICARNAQSCAAAAEKLSVHGPCHAITADVGSVAGGRALAAALSEREERLDIVVHNAGAAHYATFDDFTEENWDDVMSVNLKGIFFLTQALMPLLRVSASTGRSAAVINIGSAAGMQASGSDSYSYSVSKAGLNYMTRKLARRLASENITVNTVSPGPVDAGLMLLQDQAFKDRVRADIPLGRMATSEDVAAAVLFLASPAGAYISATVLPVDGGLTGCMK